MVEHSFDGKLEYSLGRQQTDDVAKIMHALHGCERVEKTDTDVDKTGVDYFAWLKGGAVVNVDAKAREPNAARYWRQGVPELAIETWSVRGVKRGWTYNIQSPVDYILYTFADTDLYYFLPFQLLRTAAICNYHKWLEQYGVKSQFSRGEYGSCWESQCIFVPAPVVLDALRAGMTLKLDTG